MKKFISLLLALTLAASCAAAASELPFTDVSESAWYYQYVKSGYDAGLVSGVSDTQFSPTGEVTIAQAVAFAARLRSILHTGGESFVQTGTWYQVYMNYAIENGIIMADQFADVAASATRAEFAGILAHAILGDQLDFDSCTTVPDVAVTDPYGKEIYALYGAGVLTGGVGGAFAPNDSIQRSEAVTILVRGLEVEPSGSITVSAADVASAYKKFLENRVLTVTMTTPTGETSSATAVTTYESETNELKMNVNPFIFYPSAPEGAWVGVQQSESGYDFTCGYTGSAGASPATDPFFMGFNDTSERILAEVFLGTYWTVTERSLTETDGAYTVTNGDTLLTITMDGDAVSKATMTIAEGYTLTVTLKA